MAPAEAEADREDALARSALWRAEPRDGRGDIGLNRCRLGLCHVLHVGEVVIALAHSAGAAEVVDRDGGRPALGEAQGELLVEAVEAADVR